MPKSQQDSSYIQRDLSIIDSIKSSLQAIANGSEPDTLVHNIYGLVGIGKTYALQQIYDHFKDNYRIVWLSFKTVENAIVGQHIDTHLQLSVQTWANALKLLARLPGLQQDKLTTIQLEGDLSIAIEHMGLLQSASYLVAGSEKPVLLLLDALDNLPYWKWLQEYIIKPLIDKQQTVLVSASCTPLFWHFWEVRECCTAHELSTFTLPETEQFLAQSHRGRIAQAIHTLTDGYPLALSQFVVMLDEPITVAESGQNIAAKLDSAPDELRELLHAVGIMRRVHKGIMVDLLKASNLERSAEQLENQLKEARQHGFIRSHHDTSNRLMPQLRIWLQATTLPSDTYAHSCSIIAERYYTMATNKPRSEDAAIIEWLYFSTEQFVFDQAADRQSWIEQLGKLGQRLADVYPTQSQDSAVLLQQTMAPNFVRLLYLDGELLQKLAGLQLLPTIENVLLKQFDGLQPALARDVARACSNTLQQLGKHFMENTLKDFESFETTLRYFVDVSIKQTELRAKFLAHWPTLQSRPIRSFNELFATVSGDGIMIYDRQSRQYDIHPVIDTLLLCNSRAQ